MPENSLRVVARIRAREENVEEVRGLLTRLIEPTRQEPGCIKYELLQNSQDPTDFTFVEEWTSRAALLGHFETEHFRRIIPRVEELAAEPPDVRTYSPLEP